MMLMTILTALGGGLLRLLPELIGLLKNRQDNGHELALMDKQIELQRLGGAQMDRQIELKGDVDQALAIVNAKMAALAGQMQKINIFIVDLLNFLVRPVTTYYFLALYGLYKIALFVVAVKQGDVWTAVLKVYDNDDREMLWGILGFWFVGRVFDSPKK